MRFFKEQKGLKGWQAWEAGAKNYLIIYGIAIMVLTFVYLVWSPSTFWPYGFIFGLLFGTLVIVLGIVSRIPGVEKQKRGT